MALYLEDDDFDIRVDTEGTLLSSHWEGHICDDCGCYHIDLKDRNEKVFASLRIAPQDMHELGRILMECSRMAGMSTLN